MAKQQTTYSIKTYYSSHSRTHSLRYFFAYKKDRPKEISGGISSKKLSHAKIVLDYLRKKYPNHKHEIIKVEKRKIRLLFLSAQAWGLIGVCTKVQGRYPARSVILMPRLKRRRS